MDLVSLVEAVVVAGLTDEGIWIELDLNGTGGAFEAARTILGFANRMPRTADNFCERALVS